MRERVSLAVRSELNKTLQLCVFEFTHTNTTKYAPNQYNTIREQVYMHTCPLIYIVFV